ncbi:MAG: carboxypeptidase [Anaerolineae bacterium]|nr:carboxypeptidase [Anaerolineae bacterium]
MPALHFDRFYRYDELTKLLHAFAEEYPQWVTLQSIGKSYEGRDIWLVAVTNRDTGPAEEKPALWVDGNIHASEVSPSSTCLYLLNTLVNGYGSDEDITRCLDTRAFYICPRVNPDGAEWALADQPKIIRSSTRPHPYDEEPIGGLVEEDMDGDGRMLQMRIEDPNGAWKVHPDEPRLMVRRDPIETGGTYYRLLPEGRIENYDGVTIFVQPVKEGLDLNRNFPAGWRSEKDQPGAGPYPVSEPEVQAVVDFIARHKNITGGVAFHTWSGVLLRPFGDKSDDEMAAEDVWTYQKIGQKGTDITGYPHISIFHDFRYHPRQVISGGFDWIFEHLGLYMWGVEIWSPQRQAGIEEYKFIDWYREHPVEDDLKMLRWSDEKLEGKGYIDWYAYEHPQLGKVELGGWDTLYAWRNPPPQYLEAEIARFPEWLIWQCLISPRLELISVEVTPLGGNYRVRAVVQNTGWLPTYVSKQGLNKKVVRGVIAELELPEGVTLHSGERRVDLGQLEGRAYSDVSINPDTADETKDRAKVEWIISGAPGTTLNLTLKQDRAGVVRSTVTLPELM